MKRWRGKRLLHQCADIMVAGHAVHRHAECTEKITKVLVCLCAVVLDQVTGDDGEVSLPVAVAVVVEDRAQ